MATNRTFQDMLNEFLPNKLLKEELVRRDYLLSKVEKDNSWKGGTLIVPFKAAGASSVSFGGLTADNDISQDQYVRGEVSGHKELWGAMIFNHRDIMEHDKISEQNFLKLLPETIEDFMDYIKNVVSTNLLNGAHFATLTVDGTAGGLMTVDRPDRFIEGQKVTIDDSNSSPLTGFVDTVDINTQVVHIVTTRGGSTDSDLSPYTVPQDAKCFNDGAQANSFTSLRSSLLSLANGGDAALYGVTKTDHTYLQAINENGNGITATNIMEKIFDALTEVRQKGRGNPTDVVMSYKNFASAMKVIEGSKGAFNVSPGSKSTSQFGWTEIEVGSVTNGGLKLVGVQEMDDDIIIYMDWRALKFYSNGFFRKRKSPEGLEFFTLRKTTGYEYIVDISLFGDLVLQRPSMCGIIHSISY